jgi:hypothetical protein
VPALKLAQAGAGGDPVEPGAQRRAALELVVAAQRAQVGLLHQVLGVVHGAEHPVAVGQQLAPVRLNEQPDVRGRGPGQTPPPRISITLDPPAGGNSSPMAR